MLKIRFHQLLFTFLSTSLKNLMKEMESEINPVRVLNSDRILKKKVN